MKVNFACADNYINQSPILYFMTYPYLLKRGKVRRTGSDGRGGVRPAKRAVAATLQVASKSQVNRTVATLLTAWKNAASTVVIFHRYLPPAAYVSCASRVLFTPTT
jgi:hypothetical protein